MLDSRYILAAGVIGKYRTGLILYDSFYGQKRFVEIEGAHFNFGKYSPIKLHILKPNRLLMFDGQSLSETDLALVELDLEKMKGEFLYCNQFGSSILSDSADPEKFVVISPFCGEVDEPQIHCVKTDENSDSYDALMQKSSEKETTLLKFSGTFAHRYINNRLQCLKHEYIDGKEMLSFYEYDLSASKLKEEVEPVKLFEVSVEDEEIKDWYDGEFCWQGNQCFVDFRTYRLEKSCTRFYVFDIESQKLTSLNIGCMGSCFAINVDTDGFLLAQMLHYDSNISHYSVHRFALKEPDTLRNLCLFTIHHNPTLFKHPFYGKLISQLPLQLQPLAICPNKTEADKLMNVTKVEKRRQSDYLCFYEWKQKRLEVKKKEELNML
ncbi:hypothetical protein M3Y97_00929000 [Aphelenchoides bicaudatus]|nr:hypothetical protein M3Y97_00929000 [Aphelenchoides bicaudatus]